MRKIKVLFTFIIIGLIMCVTNVKASRVLTPSEYSMLRQLFSEGKVASLTDDEIEYYLSLEPNSINTTHKYYKVTETLNGTISTEVSELEAMMNTNGLVCLGENGEINATSHTTAYKHISISTTYIGSNRSVVWLYTEWLNIPNVKSFDVTGIRLEDAYVISGTQDGTQSYKVGNTMYHINYSYNGTNIKNLDDGFGISMNLVDNGTYFATDISAYIQATSSYAHAYGAYQHAVDNVTLETSKSYTLNSSGFGHVFNFATGAGQYYDNMQGVDISLYYS